MRKKVCGSCGKIYEGVRCQCKKTAFEMRNANFSSKDDLIHSTAWRKKRMQIIKRDGFACMRCFIKYNIINSEDLTVHHILSRKNHPDLMFEDSNLVCLCSTCNKQLGTKDKLDFEWTVKEEVRDINL